jgi:hypothetical protein
MVMLCGVCLCWVGGCVCGVRVECSVWGVVYVRVGGFVFGCLGCERFVCVYNLHI